MGNLGEDTQYIYLEFNEKLTPSIFDNKMFLRVANLQKSNPLVQLNDLVFKGIYDECVGTNLFFKEIEDPPLKTNIFEKDTPIRLEPVITQTKIIRLKQMKLPKKVSTNKQCRETVILNLNQDYNTVLEKLEQGILNIEDVSNKEVESHLDEQFEEVNFNESVDDPSHEPEREIDSMFELLGKNTHSAFVEAKYERLKRLARRPVKRMKSPELVAEPEPQYREAYEYHNLERQVCQSSDAFRSVCSPITEKNFIGGVDLDRCVLHGLISPSNDLSRELTTDEQSKIFTLDNLENLSIPARYLVLKQCVARIEELVETTPTEELKDTDENGRTIQDICNIFRKLIRALEYTMMQSSDCDNFSVESRLNLKERHSDAYIKYKYSPADLFQSITEIFNPDEWTDTDVSKEDIITKGLQKIENREESDASVDDDDLNNPNEDSDLN